MTASGEPTLRVIVIEDQTLLRRRLVERLSRSAVVQVVGEGGDGLEAHRLACMYRPDAILLDATLPDGSCLRQVRRFHERFASIAVVVLHPEPASREVRQLLLCGARAVISKEGSTEAVEGALGGHAPRPGIEGRRGRPAMPLANVPTHLTEREVAILLLVAQSASNRQIASQLEIREKTVRNHVWHLSAKLGLAHRREAADVVASLGLIA